MSPIVSIDRVRAELARVATRRQISLAAALCCAETQAEVAHTLSLPLESIQAVCEQQEHPQ